MVSWQSIRPYFGCSGQDVAERQQLRRHGGPLAPPAGFVCKPAGRMLSGVGHQMAASGHQPEPSGGQVRRKT